MRSVLSFVIFFVFSSQAYAIFNNKTNEEIFQELLKLESQAQSTSFSQTGQIGSNGICYNRFLSSFGQLDEYSVYVANEQRDGHLGPVFSYNETKVMIVNRRDTLSSLKEMALVYWHENEIALGLNDKLNFTREDFSGELKSYSVGGADYLVTKLFTNRNFKCSDYRNLPECENGEKILPSGTLAGACYFWDHY